MKQKVVIIGHGYTSRLSLVRALGMKGCDVTVIAIVFDLNRPRFMREGKPIDCYSKYVSRYFIIPPDKNQLIQLLIDKCSDSDNKPVLFPDSDFSAAVVDENINVLKDFFVFPNIRNQQGAVVGWMDKLRQKDAAASVGLNVAGGCVVRVVKGIYDVPENVQYPCFVKPLASVNGGKSGLCKCCEVKQLRAAIDEISQGLDVEVLVEEFLTIDTEYALLGFSDGKNVCIPAIIHTLSLAQGGHFGVARQGEVLPTMGYEKLLAKFNSLMCLTGFVGVFDIDFFECQGEFYFGEINFRFGGSGHAITKMGVNLPGMLLDFQSEESSEIASIIINRKATFVNERMCVDDWVNGHIGTRGFCRYLRSGNIGFVRDEDDIEPYKVLKRMLPKLYIKRVIKSVFGV